MPNVIVDLTTTIEKLRGMKRLETDEISIQLVPVPVQGVLLERVGKVEASSIEIVVF
jgi:hypothetical protein